MPDLQMPQSTPGGPAPGPAPAPGGDSSVHAVVIESTQGGAYTLIPVDAQGKPGEPVQAKTLDDALDQVRALLGGEPDQDDAGGPPDADADDQAAWNEEAAKRGPGLFEGR
jgi:hypothetical protein